MQDHNISQRHQNTDIQDELGHNQDKEIIFQIDHRTDNVTARLMDNSTTSGELATRTGGAGTYAHSKASPKLASSSIGVSVEKGKSSAINGDDTILSQKIQ